MDPELFLRRVDWALLSIEPVVWPKDVDEEQARIPTALKHSSTPKNHEQVKEKTQKSGRGRLTPSKTGDFHRCSSALGIPMQTLCLRLAWRPAWSIEGDLRGAPYAAEGRRILKPGGGMDDFA